jgi:lipopolysaccharide transport system ATP-binding protein
MTEPAIQFRNVSKSYVLYHHILGGIKTFLFNLPGAMRQMRHSRFLALEDVSFTVNRGEMFGLIGRNGAGKSTALGLIAGVLKPNYGEILVRGRVSPLLELGAGFHPDLTGRENIMLNGVLMGLTRQEVRRKMEKIIEFADLGEFINEPVRTYSSGMVARLGFSVVAHLDPEILLIDEILAVGDAAFQAKCLDRMKDFRRRGVTMVFVSHSITTIRSTCDRAAWLEDHRIRTIGPSNETADAYEAFLGA